MREGKNGEEIFFLEEVQWDWATTKHRDSEDLDLDDFELDFSLDDEPYQLTFDDIQELKPVEEETQEEEPPIIEREMPWTDREKLVLPPTLNASLPPDYLDTLL
jgi:hypothetical protein